MTDRLAEATRIVEMILISVLVSLGCLTWAEQLFDSSLWGVILSVPAVAIVGVRWAQASLWEQVRR